MLDLKQHQLLPARSPGLQQHNNINSHGYGSSASPVRTSANSKLLFQQGCFERKSNPKKNLLESLLNVPPKVSPLKDQNHSNEPSPLSNRAHRTGYEKQSHFSDNPHQYSENPRRFSVSPGRNRPGSPRNDCDAENYDGNSHQSYVSPCKYDISPSKYTISPCKYTVSPSKYTVSPSKYSVSTHLFSKVPDIHAGNSYNPSKNFDQNDVKSTSPATGQYGEPVRFSVEPRHPSVSPGREARRHVSPSNAYGRTDVTGKSVRFDLDSGTKGLCLDQANTFAKYFPSTEIPSVQKEPSKPTQRSNFDSDQRNLNPLHQRSSAIGHGGSFNGSFNTKPGFNSNTNTIAQSLEQFEQKELLRRQQQAAEEQKSFIDTFSKLAARILEVWEGDDSLRKRIETLAERQQLRWDEIQKLEELEQALKQRIDAADDMVKEKVNLLNQLREDRMKTISLGMKCITNPSECEGKTKNSTSNTNSYHTLNPNPKTSTLNLSSHSSKTSANSSILYPSRAPLRSTTSSRILHRAQSQAHHISICQMASFHIFSSVHKRLTSFMCSHMCNKVNTLDTPSEKGEYLSMFRGSNNTTPFNMKPLSEATYAELLVFVNNYPKSSNQHTLKVYQATLEAAEKALCEEATTLGFHNARFGNIRNQMGVYIEHEQHFKKSSINRFGFIDDDKVTLDVVSDVVQAAQDGKLGILQPASNLIQYGCYYWSTKK